MPIDKAVEDLGLGTVPPAGNYHTVAGFALSCLGHIPTTGERFQWEARRFEVINIEVETTSSASPGAMSKLSIRCPSAGPVDKRTTLPGQQT